MSRSAVVALRRLAEGLAELPSAASAARLAAACATDLLGLEVAAVYVQRRPAGRLSLLARAGASPRRGLATVHRRAAQNAIQQDAPALDAAPGVAAIPMRAAGQVVGALVAVGPEQGHLDEEDAATLGVIAAQAAAAVGPAILNREARARSAAFQALHSVAVTAGTIRDPAELARLTVSQARELLGVDSAVLRWWDPEARLLRLLAGIDSRGRRRPAAVAAGNGVVGAAFRRQRVVVEQDYRSARNVLPESLRAGTRAAMAVPLRVHDRCVGALCVEYYSPRRFSEHDGQILSLLAAQVAPAIEAAMLAQQDKHRAVTLSSLHEVAMAATGVLDQSLLARLVADKASALLGADSAALAVWDEASGRLIVTADNHPEARQKAAGGVGDKGCLGLAFARTAAIAVDDYDRWEHRSEWPDRWRPKSALAVPLVVEDRALGALGIRCSKRRHFESEEVQLLSLLAAQVAPALQAAHLFTELQASQAQLSHVLSHAPVVLFALDREGRVMLVHGQASITSGLSGAKSAGRSILELVEGSDLELALRSALKGRTGHATVSIKGVDFDLSCSPLYDGLGRLDGIIALGVDLSERRRAEEARRESDAKSRFLATMSHELRTPLNSVLGYSQLLSAQTFGPLNDRQARYLGHIETSGWHLLELIEDILDISTIQAGRVKLVPEDVDLEPVIQAATIKIRPMAVDKKLRLEVQAEPGLRVRADRRRLEQILLNLLSNAVKFTPAEGVITVRSKAQDRYVEVAVRDSGPGIDPAHRDLIFEEFIQLDSGFARAQGGSGLGLALCRRLVELMDGAILVESRLGEGSVFRVRLPAAITVHPPRRRRSPAAAVAVPDSV